MSAVLAMCGRCPEQFLPRSGLHTLSLVTAPQSTKLPPQAWGWLWRRRSPISKAPQGTTDDGHCLVMYDSGRTDPIMVRGDAASVRANEGGSEAMLSSPSMSGQQKKYKKKNRKRQRHHSSISSSPGGKLVRRTDCWSASSHWGGARVPSASVSAGVTS